MNASYVTIKELCEYLSVSESFVRHNKIPGRKKIGRSIRYYLPDIDRAINSPGGLTGAQARK